MPLFCLGLGVGCGSYPCSLGPDLLDVGSVNLADIVALDATSPLVSYTVEGTDDATQQGFSAEMSAPLENGVVPEVRVIFQSESNLCDTEFSFRAWLSDADDPSWTSPLEKQEWVLESSQQTHDLTWDGRELSVTIEHWFM